MTSGVLVLLCSTVVIHAQATTARSHESTLQQHYEAAQRYQAAHDLERAASEYRMLLTDALGELAIGRARAGQYDKAAPAFDEALAFAPHSDVLRLEYAQAALQSGDVQHARTLAEEAVREYPQSAKAHLILGRAFLKSNNDVAARRELEQAVALDSSFANGYELAIACLNMGDQKCAATLFSEMEMSFGTTSLIHMYFGQAYLNSDFQSQAVVEFQKAIIKNPRLPGAHYSLAAAYLATAGHAKISDAEVELRKEIAISPREALAYAAVGHLEAGEQRYSEAENDLKRAIQLGAKNPDAFLYLGQLYAAMKRTAEAEQALRSSIRLTTDVSHNHYEVQKAHYILGRLLMQSGDTEEGKKELQAAEALTQENLSHDRDRLADYLGDDPRMSPGTGASSSIETNARMQMDSKAARQADAFEKQLSPAVADSYNNLGAIAGSQRNDRLAVTYFQRAAEWDPSLEGLDENWGRAAFTAGQFEQAIAPLKRYLRGHPGDKQMRAALGISLFMVSDYASARDTLQSIAEDPDEESQTGFVYAESLVRTGDASEGTARLTALVQRNPDSATFHRALGEALALSSDTTRAAQEFNAAIRLNPKDAEAYDALGRLQLAQGNTAAAVASLEQAVKLAGQNSSVHHDLAIAYRQASRPDDASREMRQFEALRATTVPRRDATLN
jgi:tetratricopeptide (TPR) repeat protein